MMRQPFLNAPAQWTQAARHGGTRVDYACPVQVFKTRRTTWRDRVLRVFALVLVLAAIAAAYA